MDYMYKFASRSLVKFLFIGGVFLFGSSSCALLNKSKAEKVEKEQEKSSSDGMLELRKAQKAHYKMQPKETRKMMKRSLKMAKKANRVRKQTN